MADNFWKIRNGVNFGGLPSDPASPQNGDVYYNNTTNKLRLYEDGSWKDVVGTGGGSGEVISFQVNQSSHGFAVLDAIRHNGTNWVKAQANSDSTLAQYIVSEVIDSNNFVASNYGKITVTGHGKTVGEYYFLSETVAGGNTSTTPTSGYNQPLFFVESANILHLMIQRGVSSELLSGGANVLDDLSDVNAPSPNDGDVLTWDDTNSEWIAAPLSVNLSSVNQNIIPDSNDSRDLGSDANEWNELFVRLIKHGDVTNPHLEISTTSNNGNLVLTPHGTGIVQVHKNLLSADSTQNLGTTSVPWNYLNVNFINTQRYQSIWDSNSYGHPSAASSEIRIYNHTNRFFAVDEDGNRYRLENGWKSIVNKTSTYTATNEDEVITCDASGGSFTINLPSATGRAGKTYTIKKTDSSTNTVTIDANASETIDGSLTKVISTQYESLTIVCDGSNWHII